MSIYSALATAVVVAHLLFVAFVLSGGWLAVRWPQMAWLHVPAACWAAYVELSGGTCPLTALEQALRRAAGLEPYTGDFIANYIFPVLYPETFPRSLQLAIGTIVVAISAAAYVVAWRRHRRILQGRPV